MELINVVIVDDHKMVVESLSGMINQSGIARVTGKYYDLKSCRQSMIEETPDVLLLDVALPDGDGIDFCGEITKARPKMKIIMLTGYKEFNIACHALQNGALGYILKNADVEDLIAGIKTVYKGEQYIDKEMAGFMKNHNESDVVNLTGCEREILQHIARGYTRKEIARRIYRSEDTVKTHWRNLLVKLDASNAAELIKKAGEQNLIKKN